MLSEVIALMRRLVRSLLGGDSPSQLAAGFTLGMIIGVMPKDNLIALSLCVLLFSIRCNTGLGLLTAFAFSFAGPWTDPFAARTGLYVLSIPSMQAAYASTFNMPLGPWLGFNNTVVTGTLILGLYVAYPVYWFTRASLLMIRSAFTGQRSARLGVDDEIELRVAA